MPPPAWTVRIDERVRELRVLVDLRTDLVRRRSLCAFGRRIPPAVLSLARAYGEPLARWGP
ncbi:hypothetical protein [Streptomyces sp. NPDC001292]|uniref:hypothetical protein n=1 Tax=Streptomyces sp. NPDC001292 TaxID=3364558 RepID=UPI0036ABB330